MKLRGKGGPRASAWVCREFAAGNFRIRCFRAEDVVVTMLMTMRVQRRATDFVSAKR